MACVCNYESLQMLNSKDVQIPHKIVQYMLLIEYLNLIYMLCKWLLVNLYFQGKQKDYLFSTGVVLKNKK